MMDAVDQDLAHRAKGPDAPPVFFVETDCEGHVLHGAGDLANALGFAVERLPNSIMNLMSEASQSLLQNYWYSVIKGTTVHRNEFSFLNANRESCSFGLSLFPVFNHDLEVQSVRLVLSKLDIQKELSFALESAEERFAAVFQASSDLIMILSNRHELLSANPAFELSIGVPVDAFFRGEHDLLDYFSEAGRKQFIDLLHACEENQEDQQAEFALRMHDKTERWYDLRVHALRSTKGEHKGLLCIGRDIQSYKEMVHALKQEAIDIEARHEQAQGLIGRLKDFLTNINELPKDALPFVQGLGSILAKLYPSSLFLLHVEDSIRESITGSRQDSVAPNELHLLNSEMHRMVTKSDSPLYCNSLDTTDPYRDDPLVRYLELKSFIGAPMRDSEGRLLGTILLMDGAPAKYDSEDVEVVTVAALMAAGRCRSDADAADKRKLEAHLRQSQKMQAVGKLAGGIAHDFNNILSGILGFSSYLLRNAETGTDLHRDLSMIMKSAERASDLTRQLLSFSRKRHIEKKPVVINNILQEVESIITHSVAKKLKVTTELSEDIGPIMADDGQIHQVIMNLCINAADAMGGKKGRLTIRSCERKLTSVERQVIEQEEEGVESYAVIEIEDTGPGIPDDIREHLFEPFFTTKPENEGTGLGLSIVYGIVTNHGGGIKVDSESGNGATFTIFLPVCSDPEIIKQARSDPDAHLRGHENILIVDDEAIVRQMAAHTLKGYGYQVSVANGGREATSQILSGSEKFDLVLIDMNMPDLNGAETIDHLLDTQNSTIKAMIMSGLPQEDPVRQYCHDRDIHFIQKPFTAEVLAKEIRSALDS